MYLYYNINMPKSVYIHIPFCLKKCAYCSFLSGLNPRCSGVYTDGLVKEIKNFYRGEKLNTLYFGGGTPSLLSVDEIQKILKCFKTDEKTEITLEVNPKTCDKEKLKAFKNAGVNRISLGVQSFDDKLLKIAGRTHSAKEALQSIENIVSAGFENYSIDLIYGLPSQSLEMWHKTLDKAKSLMPPHISLYGLKIDKGCDFYKNPPKDLPDDDLQADMYEAAVEVFAKYRHYEFSNFARSFLFRSRHNLTYWNLAPYYGFGLGASGFSGTFRYQNECNFEEYLKNPAKEKLYERTNLLEEHIFLGFRKSSGININKINRIFKIDFDKKYALQLEKFLTLGLIQKTLHGYKLTLKGVMLSNSVLCEFLDDVL